jgi:hypothetical protein
LTRVTSSNHHELCVWEAFETTVPIDESFVEKIIILLDKDG